MSALRKSLFYLPIVGNIAWEVVHNIDGLSVLIHSVMDVRPGGIAGAAAPTDDIALGNRLPCGHIPIAHVAIQGGAIGM